MWQATKHWSAAVWKTTLEKNFTKITLQSLQVKHGIRDLNILLCKRNFKDLLIFYGNLSLETVSLTMEVLVSAPKKN